MSREKRIVEITPGRMIPGGRMTECLEGQGHSCPYCQGNGYHWQEDEYQERIKRNARYAKAAVSSMPL
nr:hypothetical protein [Prevotella intermedia]